MRRRTIRPSTQTTLVVVTVVLSIIVWLGWELGRCLARPAWWRAVIAVTSGLTFVLFAIGDYLQ